MTVKLEQPDSVLHHGHHGNTRNCPSHSDARLDNEIIVNQLAVWHFHVIQKHLEFTILTRQTPAKRWFVLLFFLVYHGASSPSYTFP